MRHHDLHMKSVPLSPDALKNYDCVLIATHHKAYDWEMIAENAKLVVDTRGALRGVKGKGDNIVSA
jgi:UDP-N-acetyl-D-glucosamine dehydrogenase